MHNEKVEGEQAHGSLFRPRAPMKPQRHAPRRLITVTLLILATPLVVMGIAILVLLFASVFSLAHSRTDSLTVTAIDDAYYIEFSTEGTKLPLPPELDTTWSDGAWLLARGSGQQVQRDGVTYKKYTIGKDLITDEFPTGTMYLSEEARRLIIEAKHTARHPRDIDYSGTYNGIQVERAEIATITENTNLKDLHNRYVRMTGRLNEESGFEAVGRTFMITRERPRECGTYEVIGRLWVVYDDKPYILLVEWKKVTGK